MANSQVSVLLCRGEILVSEKFLNRPQVRTRIQQMGSKGMAECVGADFLIQARAPDILLNESGD